MIWKGIQGLLESKKGALSLIVLACATVAVMTKHIDGVSYAAIISTVAVIYNFVQHRVDMQEASNGIGPRT